jgi:hypothetical protein
MAVAPKTYRTPVASLLDACEDLHSQLRSAPHASGGLQAVLDADAHLQRVVLDLLREKERRAHGAALMRSAEEVQTALLRWATRMHTAEGRLADTIERARASLAAADEAVAADRRASTATIVEYAERVSYSNAAPCGQVAFAGAERNMFYQGWGTPTPQQHMLAAARFAHPVGADADAAEEEEEEEEPADAAAAATTGTEAGGAAAVAPLPTRAPSFTAPARAPQPASAPEERAHVSLGFGSDDEDEDDYE